MHGIAVGYISSHSCSSVSVTKCISYPSKHTPQQQTVIPSSLLAQKVGATVCALLQIIFKGDDQPSEGCTKVPPLSLAVTKRKHNSFPPPKCRQHHDYPFPTGGSNLISFPQTCHAANSADGIFFNAPSNMTPVLMALPSCSSREQRKMECKRPQ